MAQYKYKQFLTESSIVAFDTRYLPGALAENSGIYRCTTCGEEIVAMKGSRLPGAKHHAHTTNEAIKWQMIVFAQQSR